VLADRENTLQDESIPPEEQELFREFQSYVRSIYTAATSGAVQVLEAKAGAIEARLAEVTDELAETVTNSREAYADLFAPSIERLEQATASTLQEHVSRSERELARLSSRLTKTAVLVAVLVVLNLLIGVALLVLQNPR